MNYYSLNHQSPIVNFKEATIAGQAPDKGLYFPEKIPTLSQTFIQHLHQYSNEAIAYEVMKPYIAATIDNKAFQRIVEETISFPIPLKSINEQIFSLELFHGPTLAFKDVGARFMSRCLGYFLQGSAKKVTVLVATSGDTGGAVANGFYNVDGVQVVILYPSKKVSAVQEAQMTTLGNNITALEVAGTFDDCQQMVKQAFADVSLQQEIFLTSANSINVARWLPQQVYYFLAYKQWPEKNNPPVIAVPSGNFGNLCAGLLAKQSGLPIKHFVAACNANKVVPDYFSTQQYQPKPAVATISNAMDVGNPSNFIRIVELFQQQFEAMQSAISCYSITDETTITTIKNVYQQHQYLLDPHGAVGYESLQLALCNFPEHTKGIVLETAHPVKFNDTIQNIFSTNLLANFEQELLLQGNKKSIEIPNHYEALKNELKKICF